MGGLNTYRHYDGVPEGARLKQVCIAKNTCVMLVEYEHSNSVPEGKRGLRVGAVNMMQVSGKAGGCEQAIAPQMGIATAFPKVLRRS